MQLRITAAGILYCIRLNEIIIAFISLLGGFLSPVLLSSGENRPNMLFGYILILISGAMLCAAVRKWRSVTRVSFLGTIVLYSLWFNEWYSPAMYGNSIPQQLPVALIWLCVFTAIYLLMPVLYELIKRETAHEGDILLILANAVFCYIYLHQILFTHFRPYLALAAVCLAAAHFVLLAVVHRRCPQDKNLKTSLSLLGLLFITIAIPLYFKMYVLAIILAGEGIVLTFVAVQYRSRITQLFSVIAFIFAIAALCKQLPLHQSEFSLIFNNAFGSWCFVAAAFYIAHLLYRFQKEDAQEFSANVFAQILFCFSVLLLLIAGCMEWFEHVRYNLRVAQSLHSAEFLEGMVILCSICIVLFVLPVFRPAGILPVVGTTILAFLTCAGTLQIFNKLYDSSFIIFGNIPFVIALAPLAGLAIAAIFIKRDNSYSEIKQMASLFGIAAVLYAWLLLTEEIYLYWNYAGKLSLSAGIDKGQMWISIMWAIYAAFVIAIGLWRKIIIMRYLGFGLFVLVIAKVFIFDMGTLEKVHRIAGFIVLGMVLIAVSYLYQFLKKNKSFEK